MTIFNILAIDLFYWLYRNWVKLILVLGLASWLVVISWPRSAGWPVTIVFCSAGQGDETLIQRGFTQILIDGSRPGRALDCLRKHVPFFDRQIEMMIVSHPQLDHFGGLTDVVKRYEVISFVYNGIRGDSREWEEFSKAVLAEKAKIEVVAAGDEIRVGELKLRVLWPRSEYSENSESQISPESQNVGKPEKPNQGLRFSDNRNLRPSEYSEFSESSGASVLGAATSGELNSSALVMELNYGDFKALFTGDIGEEEEREMIKMATMAKNGYNGFKNSPAEQGPALQDNHSDHLSNIDVLKVAHHGSKYSSSLDFLKAVRPALAVIEVGKNSYGHPTAEAMERLKEVGARVLRTDKDGDVVVRTDGKKWAVENKYKPDDGR